MRIQIVVEIVYSLPFLLLSVSRRLGFGHVDRLMTFIVVNSKETMWSVTSRTISVCKNPVEVKVALGIYLFLISYKKAVLPHLLM
jgi:hypothetical protein